jgi:hypothetical protein
MEVEAGLPWLSGGDSDGTRRILAECEDRASLIWPNVIAPRLDEDQLAETLRRAALWLTPLSVEGFDPDDFAFLPPREREDLMRSVEDFRRVAATVPDRMAPNREQYREAQGSLNRILEILRPDRNPDVDAFRAVKVLENLSLPDDVRGDVDRIIHKFDIDSTGDPGVWVWVILRDEATRKATFRQVKEAIRRSIDSALRRYHIPLRAYILFRTTSEQNDLDRGRLR